MTSEYDKLAAGSNEAINAESVAAYLQAHPDFFQGRDELLKQLSIPHDSGQAISLLEHQVNLLRQETQEQRSRINGLLNNAHANDGLFEKTRMVILALLKASSLEHLSTILSLEMKRQFATTENHLVFLCDDTEHLANLDTRPNSEAARILGELFEKKRTYCGHLDREQTDFFFNEHSGGIASVAIVPVHLQQEDVPGDKVMIPVLALGSDNPDYFHSTQDTLFLDFIGEVLAVQINNFLS